MPHVVNGIGTWYYGKRNKLTVNGTCESCNRTAELTSYDTTLFFTILFIPVIPLAKKRVLNQCGACSKHRVLRLRDWEKAKMMDAGDLLDQLDQDRHNRKVALAAAQFAIAYQDEPFLLSVIDSMQGSLANDAELQRKIGAGFVYFSNWPEAEQAYRKAIEVEDRPEDREWLGWSLLKQDRPEEAIPYLQHIITERKSDVAGHIYYLAAGFQAQGDHARALEVMDARDDAFPQWASGKEYRKQRKISERNHGSAKRIPSKILADKRSGYQRGGWSFNFAQLIPVAIISALIIAYFGAAFAKGAARTVFLVNGTNVVYSVSIGGKSYKLIPGMPTRAKVPEGDVAVTFDDAKPGLDAVQMHIETPFWTRPFDNFTFIINPDRSAILLKQTVTYGVAPPSGPPEVLFGTPTYSITGMNYVFEEFPAKMKVEKNSHVTKTRVIQAPIFDDPAEVVELLTERVPQQEQFKFCARYLAIDPGNTWLLGYVVQMLPEKDALAFLETRLDTKPILVEWHRAYQTLMERVHPETDLRPRYQKLVNDTQRDPNAIYLLGRTEPDFDESDRLYREADNAKVASSYPAAGIGSRALAEGKFKDAVKSFQKSLKSAPKVFMIDRNYREALLADRDFDTLIPILRSEANVPDKHIPAMLEMARAEAVRGNTAEARKAVDDVTKAIPNDPRAEDSKKALKALLSCYLNDEPGYLAAFDSKESTLEAALLKGDIAGAADRIVKSRGDETARIGLVYLAASRAGKKELAEKQWTSLLERLGKGARDERIFADLLSGKTPNTKRLAERLPISTATKRVLLTVLAQRQPSQAKELLDLAARLNYHRDAISLCLTPYLKPL